MSKKIYLHLLFFCGIFCQPIFATLSDEDTSLSSDTLVRKRRVIDLAPGGQHGTVNYIVRIMRQNRIMCSGAILSHNTAISAYSCIVGHDIRNFNVLSGGAYQTEWNFHNVTSQSAFDGGAPFHLIDTIVLLYVHPPFVYTRNTGNIALYTGSLYEGSMITVFGWERVYLEGQGNPRTYMHRLRSMNVPVMNRRECENLYRHIFIISDKHMCTTCTLQVCVRDEIGGPLVLNNRLTGIHTWKGEIPGQLNPDIFVNLLDPIYSRWVIRHIR